MYFVLAFPRLKIIVHADNNHYATRLATRYRATIVHDDVAIEAIRQFGIEIGGLTRHIRHKNL
jgi:hypothetical protein